MTPILIHASVGTESAWINRGKFDQILFPDSGRFSVIERSADGSMFENEIEHLSIITLAGDTRWVKVKYIKGEELANVELE